MDIQLFPKLCVLNENGRLILPSFIIMLLSSTSRCPTFSSCARSLNWPPRCSCARYIPDTERQAISDTSRRCGFHIVSGEMSEIRMTRFIVVDGESCLIPSSPMPNLRLTLHCSGITAYAAIIRTCLDERCYHKPRWSRSHISYLFIQRRTPCRRSLHHQHYSSPVS